MRGLLTIDPADWRAVHAALRARLEDDGPAVFPASVADAPPDVPDTTALVIQTSGTTARPKRVALSASALVASAEATDAALGGPGQWMLCLSPAFVAGSQLLVRAILSGTEPVAGPLDGFEAEAFAAAVESMTGVRRYTALVPAQLARLVDAGEASDDVRGAVAALDAILIGGQALPASVASRATALGYRIVRTYGSSETATGCVYDGHPIGSTRLRIADGVLEISGPTLADGYLDDPDATAAAFVVDGGVRWYRTGDRAEVGADGRLRVLGRADNVLISGGVKVPLDRVEALVRELPGLSDAVVVRAPSERWGEVPVVVAAGAASVSLDGVRAAVAAVLGHAARPARIVAVGSLPLLATGKPDRRALERRVSVNEAADTLAVYERNADLYTRRTSTARSPLVDDLLGLVDSGARVLELGSGPGRDADALEAAGITVDRTDGARAFVEAQRRAGHAARVLDLRDDDYGGPYDAVFANAVLLHVRRPDLGSVLSRIRRATAQGGVLAASFKKGAGDAWSEHKLDEPRYFTYWVEDELRDALIAAGWAPLRVEETTASASAERWIMVLARNLE